MTMSFARHFLGAFAIWVLLAAAAAQAQAQTTDPQFLPPPIYSSIDAQGVDLASGRFNISLPGVSIGSSKSGLTQTFTDLDLHDNFRGTVERRFFNSSPHSPMLYTVTLGAGSAQFLGYPTDPYTLYGGQGPQALSGGTTLTYTDGDGSVAVFEQSSGTDSWRITNLFRADGERLTYTYVPGPTARQSIVSSLGYMVHYDWIGTGLSARIQKITAFNLAVDYCAPSAATCTFTRNWPSLTFAYSGLAVTVTDNLGRTTTVTPRTTANTGGLQRPSGASVALTFGSSSANLGVNIGRVTSASNGQATWTYGYIWQDPGALAPTLVTTATNPVGGVKVVKAVSSTGAASYYKNGLNKITTFDLETSGNALGRIKTIFPPGGGRTDYDYDARNNLRTITNTPSSGGGTIVTSANFDTTCTQAKTCNRPNYVLDGRGNRTDYTYSADHGGVTTITRPVGPNGVRPQTRFYYEALYPWYKNASGVLAQGAYPVWRLTRTSTCATLASCAGTADETVVTIAYGASGVANNLLPTSITTAAGDGSIAATMTTTYDEVGNAILVDGPLPGPADTTRNYYDAARQLTGVIGPDPDGAGPLIFRATRKTYNPDGKLTLKEDGTTTSQSDVAMASFAPLQQSQTTYDAIGRKAQERLLSGAGVAQTLTEFSYDLADRLSCRTVRLNPAATPPAVCTPTLTADGYDRVTRADYDAADQVIQLTSGYGTSFARIEKALTYTDTGKVLTEADGKGNLTTYEYDGYDRLAKTRYPNKTGGGSSFTDFEAQTYDAADNVVSRTRRGGAGVTYVYDALNRQAYRSDPQGYFYYDNLDRPTVTYAGLSNEKVNLQYYDGLGRPSATYDWTGGAWRLSSAQFYDLAGRRTWLQWSDGLVVTYAYNLAGDMTGVWESGTTPLIAYAYNDLGRRTATYRGNGAQSYYGYDAAWRLNALTLDLAGTSQDQSYGFTYNAANQVKTRSVANTTGGYLWSPGGAGSKTYTTNGLNQYDTVTGVTFGYDVRGNLTGDGAASFTYDLANRLVSKTGGASVSLDYDPLGRLGATTTPTTTRLFYVGQDLIEETDASYATIRRYVPGAGTDEPVVWYEGAGTADRRYLLADYQGSIVAVTNGSGAATALNAYDEYGVPAAGNQGRFQYTGQTWLAEVGVYHYKARAYSPTLGRFLQTDPTGYDDGLNWYAYVGNDPLNRGDPTGTTAKIPSCTTTGSEGCPSPPSPPEEPTLVDPVEVNPPAPADISELADQRLMELALDDQFGRRADACYAGFLECVNSANRLYDLGWGKESSILLMQCRITQAQCERDENEVQNDPKAKEGVTEFPPNKPNGGFVYHRKGMRPRYVGPVGDPLAGVPKKKRP